MTAVRATSPSLNKSKYNSKVESALKLQELVKERIKEYQEFIKNIDPNDHRDPIKLSLNAQTMIIELQSLVEESEG